MVFFKDGVGWDYEVAYSMDVIQEILRAADEVYSDHGKDCWVTALMDGTHRDNSKHYSGEAVDLRTRFFDDWEIEEVYHELQLALGNDFDVVVEPTHIHCEYDPN